MQKVSFHFWFLSSASQLCTVFLLLHLSSTSTVPAPNCLFPSCAASNQSSLLVIFLSMPTPQWPPHLSPCFILCGSALNSWAENARVISATIQLCNMTLRMWCGCLRTSALGGSRCNSLSSLDSIGLGLMVLVFLVLCFKEGDLRLSNRGCVAYLEKLFIGTYVWSRLVYTIPLKLLVFDWRVFVECIRECWRKYCEGEKFSQK